jgi:leucine dehydrogenase
MELSFEAPLATWDGLGVVIRHHAPSGSWIFVALHDDTLGTPVGGTRLRVYDSPRAGLIDALRLAEGMTHKWAALGAEQGGGKCVLAVPAPLEGEARFGLLRRYASLLNSLRGAFATGRDLGTTDEDIALLAGLTPHVHSFGIGNRSVGDPGPYTARGVLAAIRAIVRVLDGDPDLRGRTVAVQGLGAVGTPLARRLAAAGARVVLADVDCRKAERLANEVGGETVSSSEVLSVQCDVLAPCATGGILDARTIPHLRCRAVAGAANNQLATREDAGRLHERGILYAPDFVTNGGAALVSVLLRRGQTDEGLLGERLDAIEDSMRSILEQAAARNESPLDAAMRIVRRKLSSGRAGPSEP